MAQVNLVSATSNSATVNVIGLDTTYSRTDRRIDWYLNGSFYQSQYITQAYISQTPNFTFTNLQGGMQHQLQALIWYSSSATSGLDSYANEAIYVTLPGGGTRPSYFYWSTYGNAPPNDSQRAFKPKAAQWNNLVSNIIAVGNYKNRPYSNISTVSSGQAIYATYYIQAANAINYITNNSLAVLVPPSDRNLLRCNWFYNVQNILNNIT